MKKLRKFIIRTALSLVLLMGALMGSGFIYIQNQMNTDGTSYTETVENAILDLVPDEGITVRGRTYDYWSIKGFLDEIRYDPYNYVHKDHHCVLQYVPEEEIHLVVSALRAVMGCQ